MSICDHSNDIVFQYLFPDLCQQFILNSLRRFCDGGSGSRPIVETMMYSTFMKKNDLNDRAINRESFLHFSGVNFFFFLFKQKIIPWGEREAI